MGDRVEHAEKAGFSEEAITNLAYEIGGFLEDKVDPQNDSNRVLKEIWEVGSEDERKAIARLMVKLAKKNS